MWVFLRGEFRRNTKNSKKKNFLNENLKITELKQIPYYIESMYCPYSKAKISNKPLFSKQSSNFEKSYSDIKNKSSTESKFQTSHYPSAPLGKELKEKVNSINSYRSIEKASLKGPLGRKPIMSLNINRKANKPNKIILSFKQWEKFKKNPTIGHPKN